MIVQSLEMDSDAFARGTGWIIKPEGACRGEVCVPLPPDASLTVIAETLGMPIVADDTSGVWALGPATIGGKALTDARAPSLVLPDRAGNEFDVDSLRGQKVLLLAWASW